ncbi:MAG: threonylcarbamoyl-AMP synthase [Hyphomonas sp.]|uniref:L-threonylcarbamoyladenylate synthase n=1 Tax=Hyphomonas sp. TaxID=87 RepID=UPI0025BBC37A|nr:L-threonylcarbamoyladenylate synthase [Hyphomonas sp.]MBA4337603.1 threonylcarbamoyl-AMP synthase [Hyphomonas sp.]
MTAPIVPILPETIALAAEILSEGGLVAIPTETVYGLAADAANPEAVARLYEAKGRPRFNPLIAHISSWEMAEREAEFSPLARTCAEAFWPGPLTLVLPVKSSGRVSELARAGLETLAVRWPKHRAAAALIEVFGRPLVAPSANRSGHVSPTRAEHVAEDLGERISLILDGGPCDVGMESTILGFQDGEPVLLRPGGVATETISAKLGRSVRPYSGHAGINAPGQMKSHYSPRARLRLNAMAREDGEGFLAFGPFVPGDLSLSTSGDLVEAAANLFEMLRSLDTQFERIAVSPVPATGLGEAINDRLERAAYREAG